MRWAGNFTWVCVVAAARRAGAKPQGACRATDSGQRHDPERKHRVLVPGSVLALIASIVAAPAVAQTEAEVRIGPADAPALIVRGTTDADIFLPVLRAFLATEPDLAIRYEQWGSNDLFARATEACAGGAEAADLLVSSAVDSVVRLANDGCAQAHVSEETATLPAGQLWRDEVFGITQEPAVMVVNRAAVPDAPVTRFDLIDMLRPGGARESLRVATYDIEESGLGYLFAFMDSLQATTFGSLIEAFDRSGAVATCCSAELIDGVIEGRWDLAYNVLGSYAEARAAESDEIAIVAPEDYTLMLSRAAFIPAGAARPEAAGRLVDFMLSGQGRAVLRANHLIPRIDGLGVEDDVSIRPIPLTPVLLLTTDAAKRRLFIELWRNTFPGDRAAGP